MLKTTILALIISMKGDFMHSMGKMYVVVSVVVLVLIGLFAYLIQIDRKITNIEKKIEEKYVR